MKTSPPAASESLFEAVTATGRYPIIFTGLFLALCGGFTLFQSATGQFLPHDVAYLNQTAEELCTYCECRIVYFMFHDRVAFGGALVAIGILYMWLGGGPLTRGESWAWWTLVFSGTVGFGSFFAWLGYGYLDQWHLAGTLVILPSFIIGLWRGWTNLKDPRHLRCLLTASVPLDFRLRSGIGRACCLLVGLGLMAGGLVILFVGMTAVFVPQDLAYMGVQRQELQSINERLIPLIAHDRAGFGGALLSTGVAFFFCTWCARPNRILRQILALAGMAGFVAAIGVHYLIGYTDIVHLAPAWLGVALFVTGIALYKPPFTASSPDPVTASNLN
jgi:hypothetical protein